MHRCFGLLFLLLLASPLKSENPDSLRISVGKAATAKEKIPALISLSQYWTSNNLDSAIYYSGKLQQAALEAQDAEDYYRGCYNLVSALYETGRREDALVEGHKAIAYFDKKENKAHKVDLLVLVAEKSRIFGH